MAGITINSIIQRCLDIDLKACMVYQKLAGLAKNPALADLWKHMADDETRHAQYWARLMKMAGNGELTQVFDDPDRIYAELSSIMTTLQTISEESLDFQSPANAFLLAYRMEFFLLHPSFATLFHFMKTVDEQESTPEDDYHEHLAILMQTLRRQSLLTPELELLAHAIERLWQENRKLVTASNMDPLTGTLNRRGFFPTVTTLSHLAKRNGLQVGMLMIDIDDFKHINDTYGHKAGDRILWSVAESIRTRVRGSDIVGRYGGDEFLVYLFPLDGGTIRKIADNIRTMIEESMPDDIPISVSIGAAEGSFEDNVVIELESFIAHADKALYQAKAGEKNRVALYNPDSGEED